MPFYEKHNVDIVDATGMTPLHYALMIDNNEMIESLLQKKANVYIKDENGEDAISLASSKQKELIKKYLKE